MSREAITEPAWFIQERTQRFHPGYWSEWRCVSPHYPSKEAAMERFNQPWPWKKNYWPIQRRVVRCVWRMERVPIKTELWANIGSRVRVVSKTLEILPEVDRVA